MPKRAHGQTQKSAPSSAPKKAKNASSVAVPKLTGRALQSAREATLRDKIAKADADGTLDASLDKWNAMPNKPLRTVDRSEAKARVMMDCNQCGVTQPLQPTYFRVDRDNFASSPVGHESFNNSPSTPCTTCLSTMHAVKISTVVRWVNNIIGNYSGLSAVWFWKQWVRQGGEYTLLDDGSIDITQAALCNVSSVPMTCVMAPSWRQSTTSPKITRRGIFTPRKTAS
jgi:hypothetical protein